MAAGGAAPGKPAGAGPGSRKTGARWKVRSRERGARAKAAARFETPRAQLPGREPAASPRAVEAPPPCAPRQTAAVTASESLGWRAPARAAPKLGRMTSLCPRPVLGHHFIPSLLRSVFNSARAAHGPGRRPRELSRPGPPRDYPAGIRAAPGAPAALQRPQAEPKVAAAQ